MVNFLDEVARQGDDRLTFLILDNARIHHSLDIATTTRWLNDHNMLLLYLPPYSPDLNLIEIVWKQAKHYWRRFVAWSKETIEAEINSLLNGYGEKYEINFS